MKKIIAILISLLFVGSTFGVASITATCNPSIFYAEKSVVFVGDTFTIYVSQSPRCLVVVDPDPGVLGDPPTFEVLPPVDGYVPAVFNPVAPGTVRFHVACDSGYCILEVRVLERKSLPMDQITNILEKNRCKNHPDAEGCEVN